MRTKRTGLRVAIASLAWLAFAGCSALVDPDTRTLEPEPMVCEPDEVVSCLCDDGKSHVQRCNAGGGFDPCDCNSRVSAGGSGGSAGRSGAQGSNAGSQARAPDGGQR